MKMFKLHSILIGAGLLTLMSCGDAGDMPNAAPAKQAAAPETQTPEIAFETLRSATQEGVVGIYNMPEMLTLSKMDSAATKDMAFKLGKDYSILEAEAKEIGAEVDVPGVINYNNDPKNFKFECLLLIKKIPAKEPTKCKIVALEASRIFVYNYYGPYDSLVVAYDKIRKHFKEHRITQSGPMREFYMSDPTAETNPAKWLTRIMVPVN